jgi:riboflavin kinase/FMN adenylyltransferase
MVLEVSFDLEFAGLSPEDFVSTVLKDRFAVRHLVCGTDFRFGRSGAGDIAFLRQASKSPPGFTLEIVDDIVHDSIVVRSTAVREAITIGDVGRAAEFLTRPHEIPGTVTRGLARGREIGFPTANLQPHGDLVMPLRGVYLTAVRVRDGQPNSPIFSAMTNIGFNPTFGLERLSIETHILGFDGDLVGQELEVFFLARLRDEQKFSGVEALRDQLNRDRAHCEALLATEPIRSLIGRIPPPLPPQS